MALRVNRDGRRVRVALSPQEVANMRAQHATGTVTYAQLATEYGVSRTTVHNVVRYGTTSGEEARGRRTR